MGKHAQTYFVGGVSAIGGLLFGYDTGVMSSILEMDEWKAYFHNPGSVGVGVIVSLLTAGCFVGSLFAGWFADRYSRKHTIMGACIVFSLGAAIQCGSRNRAMLIVGRFIAGLGVGVLSMTVPVFQSEISPAAIRGRLVSLQQWAITWGILVSFWIDYGCHFIKSQAAWRIPIGLQIVPAIFLFCAMFFMPYSPRWLVDNNRDDEARQVLARLRADGDLDAPEVIGELEEIKDVVRLERETAVRSYMELLRYPIRRRVVLGVVIQALQQLTGINVIMYFAPSIFKQSGLTGPNASLLAQGINGVINMLATIPAILWIDRWGRRKTLMLGSLVCGITYFVQAVATGATQHKTIDNGEVNLHMPKGPSYLVIVMIYIFVISFAASWGPIGWIYPSEIFPMHIRSKANSITTASNWLFNFVIGLVAPILIKRITWGLDLIFAIIMFASVGIIYMFFPETKSRPLEEMEIVFTGSIWAHKDRKRIEEYDKEMNGGRSGATKVSIGEDDSEKA
ncbi:general substrate transporter [Martensiomyces pterosporus]|nr:general substrate transporter [Martensiomyces pterosporus]